jgi:hypothetical protein
MIILNIFLFWVERVIAFFVFDDIINHLGFNSPPLGAIKWKELFVADTPLLAAW